MIVQLADARSMEVVEKGPLTVIGISVRATWRELWNEMPRAWQQFIQRHEEILHRVDDSFIDVSLEKVDDEYLQLIGARVSAIDKIPDGMRAVEIPAQRYVFSKHEGPVEDIAKSFGRIYDWARTEGVPAGDFKVDIGYTAAGDEHAHDLFVGLQPGEPWRWAPPHGSEHP